MLSGKIYDKAFYQMILQNAKNFHFLKRRFEALVWSSKLRPYVLQNPYLFIIHCSLCCINLSTVKFKFWYVVSHLFSNKELIKCWTILLCHLKFVLFKFEAVSLAVAAAFIFYLVVEWWRVIDFTYSIIVWIRTSYACAPLLNFTSAGGLKCLFVFCSSLLSRSHIWQLTGWIK